MNTTTPLRTMVALAGVLVITSFSLPDAAPQQAFTGKYWILESSTVTPVIDLDGDGKPDSDIRVMQEACEKDDAEMYRADGKLVKHRGSKKCEDDEEQVEESGHWSYNAATKQITSKHDDTEKPQTYTVKEVSGSKMVLVYTFQSSKGKHTIVGTFKAK